MKEQELIFADTVSQQRYKSQESSTVVGVMLGQMLDWKLQNAMQLQILDETQLSLAN